MVAVEEQVRRARAEGFCCCGEALGCLLTLALPPELLLELVLPLLVLLLLPPVVVLLDRAGLCEWPDAAFFPFLPLRPPWALSLCFLLCNDRCVCV